jgi:putative oxidoreductase
MNRSTLEDAGKLVLRLAIGGLMLLHGASKLQHGIPRIAANVVAHGLPQPFAYGVYVGEVVAPLLLIAGVLTRPAACAVAFNMVVAVWLSHATDVLARATSGGWKIELQMLYMLGALAIALLGAGRYSVTRGRGRWS